MSSSGRRIGVLGGMFDPPHIGHHVMMDQVWEALELDEIFMVPCAHPPHRGNPIADFAERVEMCNFHSSYLMDRRGALFSPKIKVSMVEYRLSAPNYSWRMVREFKKNHLRDEVFLIMGGDEYSSLPSWNRPDILLEEVNIVCAESGGRRANKRPLLDGERVSFVDVEGVCGISSTMIRRRILENRTVRHLVIPDVHDYIRSHCIYERGENGENHQGDDLNKDQD